MASSVSTVPTKRTTVAPPLLEDTQPPQGVRASSWGYNLSESLRAGQRLYGTCSLSTSPQWAQSMRETGCDFVFIDLERCAIDHTTLSWMCQTYGAMGVAPVVRIAAAESKEARQCLNGGAAAIVVPCAEDVDTVKAIIGATKLRPLRGKRLLQVLASIGKDENLSLGLDSATRTAIVNTNRHSACILCIESTTGLANLETLARLPGVDALLVEPKQLSLQLGCYEDYANPKFTTAVDAVIATAVKCGIGAGVHYSGPSALRNQAHWARRGANLIVHSSDMDAFRLSMTRDLLALRGVMGDAVGTEEGDTQFTATGSGSAGGSPTAASVGAGGGAGAGAGAEDDSDGDSWGSGTDLAAAAAADGGASGGRSGHLRTSTSSGRLVNRTASYLSMSSHASNVASAAAAAPHFGSHTAGASTHSILSLADLGLDTT